MLVAAGFCFCCDIALVSFDSYKGCKEDCVTTADIKLMLHLLAVLRLQPSELEIICHSGMAVNSSDDNADATFANNSLYATITVGKAEFEIDNWQPMLPYLHPYVTYATPVYVSMYCFFVMKPAESKPFVNNNIYFLKAFSSTIWFCSVSVLFACLLIYFGKKYVSRVVHQSKPLFSISFQLHCIVTLIEYLYQNALTTNSISAQNSPPPFTSVLQLAESIQRGEFTFLYDQFSEGAMRQLNNSRNQGLMALKQALNTNPALKLTESYFLCEYLVNMSRFTKDKRYVIMDDPYNLLIYCPPRYFVQLQQICPTNEKTDEFFGYVFRKNSPLIERYNRAAEYMAGINQLLYIRPAMAALQAYQISHAKSEPIDDQIQYQVLTVKSVQLLLFLQVFVAGVALLIFLVDHVVQMRCTRILVITS